MRTTRSLLGLLAGASLLVAACGSDSKSTSTTASATTATAATTAAAGSAATTAAGTVPTTLDLPDKLKIGAPLDTSGSAAIAVVGSDELAGEQMAVAEINDSGYLGSTKLDLDFVDTQAAKDVATQTVIAMTTTDKVDAIIGFSLTPSFLAAGPIAQAAKIPIISVGLSGTGVTEVGNYVFRVYPAGITLLDASDPQVIKALDAKKAGYIFSNDSSNVVEQSTHRQKLIEGMGVQTVANEGVKSDAIDYQPQLTAIKAGDPDVLVVSLNGGQTPTFLTQLQQSGLEVPLLVGLSFGEPSVVANPEAQCAVFATTWDASSTAGKNPEFVKNYQERTGRPASLYSAWGYDGVWMYATAVRNAGSADPAKVRDALAALKDFSGALGVYGFDENRNPIQTPVMLQIDGGKTVPWTPDKKCTKN